MGNKDLYGLTRQGYNGYKEFDPSEFDMKRIDAIRKIIRPRLEKMESYNDRAHSYTLKMRCEHQIEAVGGILGGYVQNGELIYAMILEGFKLKRNGINAYFYVTTKSLKRLPRYPEYDKHGKVYEGDDKCLPKWKPVYKIDADKYREILNGNNPKVTVIDK